MDLLRFQPHHGSVLSYSLERAFIIQVAHFDTYLDWAALRCQQL
jgi:hypothetical protein